MLHCYKVILLPFDLFFAGEPCYTFFAGQALLLVFAGWRLLIVCSSSCRVSTHPTLSYHKRGSRPTPGPLPFQGGLQLTSARSPAEVRFFWYPRPIKGSVMISFGWRGARYGDILEDLRGASRKKIMIHPKGESLWIIPKLWRRAGCGP